jgi:uncharacterized protein
VSGLATLFSKVVRAYTGVELRPHFLLSELGAKGSALCAFIGPCSVRTEHLVDWEDRLAGDRIEAKWMVHFIGEFFGASLREGVLLQRLFVSILGESLSARLEGRARVRRDGDDLFVRLLEPAQPSVSAVEGKLTVSIVTSSPVSQLLHAGVNIDCSGAPVAAIGLRDLGILPEEWVPGILERFAAEYDGVQWACAKVRPVM